MLEILQSCVKNIKNMEPIIDSGELLVANEGELIVGFKSDIFIKRVEKTRLSRPLQITKS